MERNVVSMYEARRHILALGSETPPAVCLSDQQLEDSCPHLHNNRLSPLPYGNMLFVAALHFKVS